MFFDVYKYIYSESLFSALDIGMNHMLKKCPSEKINVTKTELFFFFTSFELVIDVLLIRDSYMS